MPRRVRAKDKWLEAEVSRGATEDDPVLDTLELQGEEQRLDEGFPQKAPLPKEVWVKWDLSGGTVHNWIRVNTSSPY